MVTAVAAALWAAPCVSRKDPWPSLRTAKRLQFRCVPTQKFRGAHSAFAFQLHVPQRKRALAGGNDQSALAAQNFAWLAAEIDKRCGKDFQVLSADLRKRARPRIEAANFSLDYFRRFGPINFPVFPLQLWRISRKRIVLRSARRASRGEQAQ